MKKILSFKLFESYSFFQSKQNKYIQLFQKLEDEGLSEEDAKELWNQIYGYRMAIKNQNREDKLQNARNLEEVEDILLRVKLVSRATQWAKLIPSHLRNEVKSKIEEFADIIANYDDYENFRTAFMRKVARYRDVNSFFDGLKNHVAGITDDYDEIINKIEATDGIEVESALPDQIIAWAYLYSASKICGSQQWCIAYSDSYWNSYVLNSLSKQYFIWDFNHGSTDKEHQIGVTVDSNTAAIKHAHFGNDYDAKTYVEQQNWRKNLVPLSNDQKSRWIKSLIENNIHISNFKTAIEISLELGNTEEAKALLKNHKSEIKGDTKYAQELLVQYANDNDLDFVKFLVEELELPTIFEKGLLIRTVYEQGNAELLSYLISKITPIQKQFIKNFSEKSGMEEAVKFYDIISGKLKL